MKSTRILLMISLIFSQAGCATLFDAPGTQNRERSILHRPVSGDVSLGMDRGQVRSEWGEPRRVQVAGDQRSGNERWVYQLGPAEEWGTSRIIYFENGRVAGWETDSEL